ncbi:hypothetical protein [Neptunomonas antarctica]|uniref:Uncharacterized protein n=1 Tax=Neptunomonas antarctica TaxID=619304 RepID=A0A1N7NC55_9GAMM|nr:hypothetical protein [Neptunomonas antarctica]SIS95965.1 hypothetical protein SAMN05421760_1092 [Neptunomonas antarctica]
MNKLSSLIIVPALLGLVLLGVVHYDLYLFSAKDVTVQAMLIREISVVILGLISSLFGAAVFLYCLAKKFWLKAGLSMLSILVFLFSFTMAGVNGGAFLNAT